MRETIALRCRTGALRTLSGTVQTGIGHPPTMPRLRSGLAEDDRPRPPLLHRSFVSPGRSASAICPEVWSRFFPITRTVASVKTHSGATVWASSGPASAFNAPCGVVAPALNQGLGKDQRSSLGGRGHGQRSARLFCGRQGNKQGVGNLSQSLGSGQSIGHAALNIRTSRHKAAVFVFFKVYRISEAQNLVLLLVGEDGASHDAVGLCDAACAYGTASSFHRTAMVQWVFKGRNSFTNPVIVPVVLTAWDRTKRLLRQNLQTWDITVLLLTTFVYISFFVYFQYISLSLACRSVNTIVRETVLLAGIEEGLKTRAQTALHAASSGARINQGLTARISR